MDFQPAEIEIQEPIRIYVTDVDVHGADQTDRKDHEPGAIRMLCKDPVGISGVFKSLPWDAFNNGNEKKQNDGLSFMAAGVAGC